MVEPVTHQSASTFSAASTGKLRLLATICSCLAFAIGLLILISWHAHWTNILQMRSDLVPMQYNTAVCFLLAGTSLLLLIWRGAGLAAYVGAGVLLLGGLTLLEYITGLDLGINQLFFKPYITIGVVAPGQMAPLSASCFTFTGATLILMGLGRPSSTRLMAAGMFSSIISMVACVALFGYITGIEAGYGWGSYIRMAMPTATAFLFLSLGMLTWAWQLARQINFSFLRWLPVTASVTLMIMVAITSGVSFSQLKSSLSWRKHSYEVLAKAQVFLGTIFDSQRGMRGYVLTGQLSSLDTYQSGASQAPVLLGQLKVLVRDNSAQTDRLNNISTDLDALLAYSSKLVDVRKTQGLQAAIQLESEGEGFATVNRLINDLKAFTKAETLLLNERTSTSEDNFRNTSRLLVFASALAATLLLLANMLASREVNSRRMAEIKLQEVASFQKAILNSADHAIITTNQKGLVTTFNETAERWLGYSAKEVIGKTSPALWHEPKEVVARAEVLSRELGRKIEPGFDVFVTKVGPGISDEGEWTFIRKDGSRFPVLLTASVMMDATGQSVGYLGIIADLTARKEMERELEVNRSRFDNILKNSLDGVLACDAVRDEEGVIRDFKFTLANPAAEKISRLTAKELIDHRMLELFPNIASDGLFQRYVEVVETGKTIEFEYCSNRTTPPRWYRLAASKLGDGLSINYMEITERKTAEQALRHQAEIIDQTSDTIFVRDLEDKITYWNRGAQNAYGWTQDEVLGKITHTVLTTEFPEPLEKIREQLMTTGHWEGELLHKRRDGAKMTVISRWTLQKDENGKPIRIIEMNFDVTERKRMEVALHDKNIELENAAQAKNRFLANMSHELRTPLNGIIGFSELLVDGLPGEINADQKEYLEDILSSSHHLLQLINDVLDLAKVEAGRMDLHPDKFAISQAIEQVCSVAYPIIQKKKIQLTTTIAPEIDKVVLDQQKLKQVLYNLLSNAVKFTEERGQVGITVAPLGTDRFTLAVSDTGIGIRPENMKRLFKEFEQLDEGTTRLYQGTGLGLALTRKILEMQGGTITVTSEFGKGSTFTATLPLTMEGVAV